MQFVYLISRFAALIFTGAIFGFFYAYWASAINGLDTMPGAAAIDAMNAINAAVGNGRFFPAFFLTGPICLLAAGLALTQRQRPSAVYFALAAVIYMGGGVVLTATYNVPMNEALMLVNTSQISAIEADQIWDIYSSDWAFWNLLRTIFSGISLVFVGLALKQNNT